MAKRRIYDCLVLLLAVIMSLSVVAGVTSCSMIEDILELELDDDDDDRHSGRVTNEEHSKPKWDNVTVPTDTYETIEPTGSYTSPTYETHEITSDYLTDICVYNVWYDPIDDNPIDYTYVYSEDAFALKGVFYFSAPLDVTFEAQLYKDNDIVMTREVTLNGEVTAECDFSAGLEGLGTFESGTYMIELLYEGESISITDSIEVEEDVHIR